MPEVQRSYPPKRLTDVGPSVVQPLLRLLKRILYRSERDRVEGYLSFSEVSHASHACFYSYFPRLEIALYRGNGSSSFKTIHGVSGHPWQIIKPDKPQEDIHSQSRWDPLMTAFMMVKLKRKATVFRYPLPSSPKMLTIIIYQEPYKPRR